MNPSNNNIYNDWDDDWETSDVTLVRTPAQQQALEARQREEEEDHLLTEALFRGKTMSSAKGTVKSVVSSLQNIQQSHKKPKNEERFLANLQRQQAQAKQARERKEREKRAMELFGEASTQDDLFNTYEAIMYE